VPVGFLAGLPAAQQATFAGFAAAMAGDGFAFLHQRILSGGAAYQCGCCVEMVDCALRLVKETCATAGGMSIRSWWKSS